MVYCSRDEVREMMKDGGLNALINDAFVESEEERERLMIPIIEAAIGDAEAEIDGYLAKRYTVPMSPVPRAINKFAKDIALYNLYSRNGIDEQGPEKNYLTRYNAAIKFLALVAEGKVSIGTEGEAPGVTARTGFTVKASPRLFRRDDLKGM